MHPLKIAFDGMEDTRINMTANNHATTAMTTMTNTATDERTALTTDRTRARTHACESKTQKDMIIKKNSTQPSHKTHRNPQK